MNPEEFLEGVVAAVEHVIRTLLIGNLAHHLEIVGRDLRDMEERQHGSHVEGEVFESSIVPVLTGSTKKRIISSSPKVKYWHQTTD